MSRTFKHLRLDRIDVVDRPANPQSRIVICKRLETDVEKAEALLAAAQAKVAAAAHGGDHDTQKSEDAMADDKSPVKGKKADDAGKDEDVEEQAETKKRDAVMTDEIAIAKREAAEAKAEVLKLRDERDREFYIRKAGEFKAYGPADAMGSILRKMAGTLSAEEQKFFEKSLRAVQKQAEEGHLFGEVGVAHEGETQSPWSQIQKAVAETVQKSGGTITKEQAMTTFLQSDAGKQLYAQYTQTLPGMQPGAGREE